MIKNLFGPSTRQEKRERKFRYKELESSRFEAQKIQKIFNDKFEKKKLINEFKHDPEYNKQLDMMKSLYVGGIKKNGKEKSSSRKGGSPVL